MENVLEVMAFICLMMLMAFAVHGEYTVPVLVFAGLTGLFHFMAEGIGKLERE